MKECLNIPERVKRIESLLSKKCRRCDSDLPIGVGEDMDDRFCSESCKAAIFWQKRYSQMSVITEWDLFSDHCYRRNCFEKEEMCDTCVDKFGEYLKSRYGGFPEIRDMIKKEEQNITGTFADGVIASIIFIGFAAMIYFIIACAK